MAADQRENTSTAPAPSPPARPRCPSCGRSPWRTKEPRCMQTLTWTVSATGIRITILIIRTRCTGLRWCEWIVFVATCSACNRRPSGCTELAGASSQNWCACLGDLVYIHCILCAFWIFQFLYKKKKKKKPNSGIKKFFFFFHLLWRCSLYCRAWYPWNVGLCVQFKTLWIKELFKILCVGLLY